ncbi:right-handed parallel beta-helix repeat-containing protein [Pendulispora albinea]|uniref:Right-handed parallel beta-helix repeat-containing protein n=1 Tax=Pendulispora albinea TaxID=2741071 RepID=A0ABZ2LVI6_9BACT
MSSELAAPTSPPAAICGNTSLLSGPSTPPTGAVVVSTNQRLDAVVDSHPRGTTYWLAPGVHTLRAGNYAQVTPKDGDVFVGAPGAILDGRHDNQYAFGGHAKNVVIRYLTIQNFGVARGNNNEGVVNHDAADGWIIEYATVKQNAGAGVFMGNNDVIRYSCLKDNGQYGFSAYRDDGVVNLTLDHNEISGNNVDEWERTPGKPEEPTWCGCTGGGKFWAVKGAKVTNNWVHDNRSIGLWADTNDVDFLFEGNYISGNRDAGIMYEISYNATIRNNTFTRNGLEEGPKQTDFPLGAIYLSEAGGDARVGGPSTLEIANNVFIDNWGGVVLFENADRFCNSPANTSSGDCTLVGGATLRTCSKGTIEKEPYKSDCRWKTQNVAVHDNSFRLTPANVPGCAASELCAVQGLFSNWGTYPDWSPYKADMIMNDITFKQNNVFARNEYVGPWKFMPYDQSGTIDFATWQKAPYNQDKGSTRR